MAIKLLDVVKNFKGHSHQIEAIEMLEKKLWPTALKDDAAWVKVWRSVPLQESDENVPISWEGIEAAAEKAGSKYPQVVAAQWALESAFGTAQSGKNNYFGIKGPGTIKTTWEDYGAGPVTIKASFKDFDSPFDCVNELVTKWYKDYKGYKGVNRALNFKECCYLLKAEGYATDPVYPQKLIKLVEEND